MAEDTILLIAIIAIIVIFVLWLYIFLPARMARKRERSVIGWILLFWILSPLWGIIILLVIGDSKKKIIKEVIEELHRD